MSLGSARNGAEEQYWLLFFFISQKFEMVTSIDQVFAIHRYTDTDFTKLPNCTIADTTLVVSV